MSTLEVVLLVCIAVLLCMIIPLWPMVKFSLIGLWYKIIGRNPFM
jgi:hypothetical protein